MKNNRFLLLLLGIFVIALSQAQVPEKIDFQAIARNVTGDAIVNQKIVVRITVIKGPLPGTNEYIELHTATTDNYGLFTLPIGNGDPITGKFTSIDWSYQNYFTQVEIDPDSQGFFTMGTMGMMRVPHTLYIAEAHGSDFWHKTNDTTITTKYSVGMGTSVQKKTIQTVGDYYGKGHIYLFAYQGDENFGSAFLQARDDSDSSDIDLYIRTQKDGNYVNAVKIDTIGNVGIGTIIPERKLHISDIMRLEPRDDEPSQAGDGDLYVNKNGHIYCYLNGVWKQLDN